MVRRLSIGAAHIDAPASRRGATSDFDEFLGVAPDNRTPIDDSPRRSTLWSKQISRTSGPLCVCFCQAQVDPEWDSPASADNALPRRHPAREVDDLEKGRWATLEPGAERHHLRRGGRFARGKKRAIAVLGTALLVTTSVGVAPASAHYVQPPGEEEAAAAVVQVQVSYSYAVDVPGKGGEGGLYTATVAGPRGTGAVVSSSGAVLTGRSTAMPERGAQQELNAVNQAFRDRYALPWTEAQLAKRQRVADQEINSGLQACYASLGSCASFRRRSRVVVFNTQPARRLEGRYSEINDGLAILTTRFDRTRTPTVGISGAALQPGDHYRAVGWGPDRLLPALGMTFENGAFRDADLQKVAATFANGGDGVVIVDSNTKGDVVAVVVRGEDGNPTTVSPMKPLQFGGVGVDRGPLHPVVDQALGYFQGKHYTHALPLIQQVTPLIPDRGLLEKLQIAQAKAGGPEDKSSDASPSMAADSTRSSSWTIIAAVVAFLALATAAAILWRRGRRNELVGGEADADDDFDLDELTDEEPSVLGPGHGEPASQAAVGSVAAGHGGQLPQGPAAGTATDQAETYCPQCGVTLLAGDRFCYHCGTPAR